MIHKQDFLCLEISNVNNITEKKCFNDSDGNSMYEYVRINGMKVTMEVDTGTYATVISELCYINSFKNCKIVKIEHKLKTYDGKILQPLGKLTNLKIKHVCWNVLSHSDRVQR